MLKPTPDQHPPAEKLTAYRDGELDSPDIREHLSWCRECRAKLADARWLAIALARERRAAAPGDEGATADLGESAPAGKGEAGALVGAMESLASSTRPASAKVPAQRDRAAPAEHPERDEIAGFLDEALAAGEMRRMEAHLRDCDRCLGFYKQLRRETAASIEATDPNGRSLARLVGEMKERVRPRPVPPPVYLGRVIIQAIKEWLIDFQPSREFEEWSWKRREKPGVFRALTAEPLILMGAINRFSHVDEACQSPVGRSEEMGQRRIQDEPVEEEHLPAPSPPLEEEAKPPRRAGRKQKRKPKDRTGRAAAERPKGEYRGISDLFEEAEQLLQGLRLSRATFDAADRERDIELFQEAFERRRAIPVESPPLILRAAPWTLVLSSVRLPAHIILLLRVLDSERQDPVGNLRVILHPTKTEAQAPAPGPAVQHQVPRTDHRGEVQIPLPSGPSRLVIDGFGHHVEMDINLAS